MKKFIQKKQFMYRGIGIVLIIGLGILYGIRRAERTRADRTAGTEEAPSDTPIPLRVFAARRINFTDTLTALGNVEGKSQVELMFRKEGIIKEIAVKEGDLLSRGDMLARLDAQEDELRMEQARLEYEQHKKLFDAGVIIQMKLDQARLAFRQASEEYRKNLLEAPISGMVATIEHKAGEVINPAKRILTMFDIGTMIIKIGITENDINKLKLGQIAAVEVDAVPGVTFAGSITSITPSLDEMLRMMTAEIAVENPAHRILPGMFARASVTVYQEENALVVPTAALRTAGTLYYVYLADKNNTVRRRDIETGYIAREYTAVKTGVHEHERVIIEKIEQLKEGIPVEITNVEEYSTTDTTLTAEASKSEEK